MIVTPLDLASGEMEVFNWDKTGVGPGVFTYFDTYPGAGAAGVKWLIINAYAYHTDAGGPHNMTWGYWDTVSGVTMWLKEAGRAANEWHCLHSIDGEMTSPSCWLHQPWIDRERYLRARIHNLVAPEKIYVNMIWQKVIVG